MPGCKSSTPATAVKGLDNREILGAKTMRQITLR